MGFLWQGGQPPPHVAQKRVLVLGPDEMFDSDYQFVAGVLDEFTLRLEHFSVIVMGDGLKHRIEGRDRVYFGTDRVVLKWCDHYKLTRHMLPARNYKSEDERQRDLIKTLGTGAFCLYFKDQEDEYSRRLFRGVVRNAVFSKRTRIVRV